MRLFTPCPFLTPEMENCGCLWWYWWKKGDSEINGRERGNRGGVDCTTGLNAFCPRNSITRVLIQINGYVGGSPLSCIQCGCVYRLRLHLGNRLTLTVDTKAAHTSANINGRKLVAHFCILSGVQLSHWQALNSTGDTFFGGSFHPSVVFLLSWIFCMLCAVLGVVICFMLRCVLFFFLYSFPSLFSSHWWAEQNSSTLLMIIPWQWWQLSQ